MFAHIFNAIDYILDIDHRIDDLAFLRATTFSSMKPQNEISQIFTDLDFEADVEDEIKEQVFYNQTDHKLALLYSLVPPLLKFCHSQLTSVNRDQQLRVSRLQVLLNGDNYTAWNRRKLAVTDHLLDVGYEMYLCSLVLSKHPKSAETWAHRRWLLKHIAASFTQTKGIDVAQETDECTRGIKAHPRNAAAWTHRLVLSESMSLDELVKDVVFVHGWSREHISDHSALCYLRHILKRIALLANLSKGSYFTKLWVIMYRAAYVGVVRRQALFGEDLSLEALWNWRRFLTTAITSHRQDYIRRTSKTRSLQTVATGKLEVAELDGAVRRLALVDGPVSAQDLQILSQSPFVLEEDITLASSKPFTDSFSKRYVSWAKTLLSNSQAIYQ